MNNRWLISVVLEYNCKNDTHKNNVFSIIEPIAHHFTRIIMRYDRLYI